MFISGKLFHYYHNRYSISFLFLFFILLSLLFPWTAGPSHSAQATFAWDANTEPNLAGYKIYYGTSSRSYDWFIDVGNVTRWTVTNLADDLTYYFAATAYSLQPALESTLSNEVSNNTCTYVISPTIATFTASGGTGNIDVTTQTGCAWTASPGDSWMTITAGHSGMGSGMVSYSVDANTNQDCRTPVSTIAGHVFTVNQAGVTTYIITASASAGGNISPSESVFVNQGASQSFTITASPENQISNVFVDGIPQGSIASYTFSNIMTNHTVSANFEVSASCTLTITSTGSGTVTTHPSGSAFDAGTRVTLNAIPDPGFAFHGWQDGGCSGKGSCTLTINEDTTVKAEFVEQPYIKVVVVNKQGNASEAPQWVDIEVSNSGPGNATMVSINTLTFKTLVGAGSVTFNAALSDPLPLIIGGFAVGAATIRRIHLDVPSTVRMFQITETGTVRDEKGTDSIFQLSQTVFP